MKKYMVLLLVVLGFAAQTASANFFDLRKNKKGLAALTVALGTTYVGYKIYNAEAVMRTENDEPVKDLKNSSYAYKAQVKCNDVKEFCKKHKKKSLLNAAGYTVLLTLLGYNYLKGNLEVPFCKK